MAGKGKKTGNHWKRLRDYDEGARRARIAEMIMSPAAQRENTNEWRVARAYQYLYAPAYGDNPLARVITFLRLVGRYTDPTSSLTMEEQTVRRVPTALIVEHQFRCQTAFPGVPDELLERAMSYVERRIELVPGNGHRARGNREWLGRWSRAILAELERRRDHGDLAAPEVRDGLKLSWLEVERARADVDNLYLSTGMATAEEIAQGLAQATALPPIAFEQLTPQLADPEIRVPEIRTGPTIVYPTPIDWKDYI